MGFTIATRIWNFNFDLQGKWNVTPNTFTTVDKTIYVYKDKDFEKKVLLTFDFTTVDKIDAETTLPLMNSGSYTLNNFRTDSTEFSVVPKSINNSEAEPLYGYKVTDDHYINIQRKN
jgi:hypothetical protein